MTLPVSLPPGISVVIPVYNSENSLEPLLARLADVLPTLTPRYEVILVNDGSRDRSWAAIERLAARYPWVRGVDLMRNYGQHNALLCGIRLAAYATLVTMDDDLQHPPEEIGKLLAKLDEGYDVVYGTPRQEQHGLWRDIASQVTKYVLQTAMGAEVARQISAFRVFRTKLRHAFADYNSPFVSIDVLLTWGTTRFAAVPVRHDPRTIGVSNYTFRKLVRHTFNMVTGFSTLPLQFASLLGFSLTFFGVLVLVYVVGRALLEGVVVPGFAFTVTIIAIFSGAQLLTLGIIGEYLARMYSRTMNRPSSVVSQVIGFGAEEKTHDGE
ncbi:MAG: glycosyltransferase family 2 protein [Anaerolineae bacterium]|nr:glycosyltransferase family 2 protein [Anaerolineae bacterium]